MKSVLPIFGMPSKEVTKEWQKQACCPMMTSQKKAFPPAGFDIEQGMS